jgi:hypothetical protein
VLGLLVVVVLIYRVFQFIGWLRDPVWSYDFAAYWAAARHLLDGLPLYTPEQLAGPFVLGPANLYQYPPALAVYLAPFAALLGDTPASTANWLWLAMGALVMTVSVLTLVEREGLARRFPMLAGRGRWWAVAFLFAFPPVIDELVVGNVNALLVGLFTLAWLGIRRGDRRGDTMAGVAIGLATVIKLFPALLILWLLLAGRSRTALFSIVATVLLAAVTLPFTGLQPWLDYVTVARNLSINLAQPDALAPTFWLTPVLGFTVARVLVTVVGLALVVWVTLRTRVRGVPELGRADQRIPFGAVVIISILITPTLYGSYLTVLVVPMLLGLAAGLPLRWVALAYVLMWGGQQPGLGGLEWIVERGLPTAGVLLLLGLFLRAAAGPSGRPATSRPTSPRRNGFGTAVPFDAAPPSRR